MSLLTRLRIRLLPGLVVAALLTAVVAWQAPHQALIIAYKVCLIAVAGVAGYWLDRWTSPYARPDGYLARPWREVRGSRPDAADYAVAPGCQWLFVAACARRAIIMAACMLALGMAL